MKTSPLKKLLAATTLAFTCQLSTAQSKASVETNWEEYQKVQDFIEENVCDVFTAKVKLTGIKSTHYFSRCPSGYNSQMLSKENTVRPENYVDGKIVFYQGCNANYVCHFKVCVAKNYIVLRSPGTNYMTVSDWVASRKQKTEKDKVAAR